MKIADFGIAESTKPVMQQSFIGTDGYRAPEVMLHRTHEASIDYYALGVIAHACMLKQLPYPSAEQMKRQLRKGNL